MEDRFWQLLSVKLAGEATIAELQELDELLLHHPEFAFHAQVLEQLWQPQPAAGANTDNFYNRHLQRLSNAPDISPVTTTGAGETVMDNRSSFRGRYYLRAGIAAALLLAFVVFMSRSAHFRHHRPGPSHDVVKNSITTRKGSRTNIQLPDGTMAWLNADSKLTYGDDFSGGIREVSLQGEAYFDVVKDRHRPFIIHTKTIDIRVLGTAFNVRAYETEKSTETALFRGSVEVTLHNNPEKKIVLKPNEKLMVNNSNLLLSQMGEHNTASANNTHDGPDASLTVSPVHFEAKDSSAWETLWLRNKLAFDEETLEEVAQKIERWYDVKVDIKGSDALKKSTYSAVFDNETLDQVMEALTITGKFSYTIDKKLVSIR